MYVIGTAGHVDHGKSLLVEALTGIDPDRLREEKARGMTIDLGFAWLTLPSGRTVSIVDVPGHERFIKNMLAGAGGVDLALLVVAADDGVMPQTREHLAILDLLGVSRGVVALTKTDLVDDEWPALVAADIEETLRNTALEGSPIVECSARTGAGLEELKRVLDEAIGDLTPKRDIGRPRLPIDRVFTIEGFGTVVTGTLIDGTFEVGDEIEAVPGGARGRIRGLQSHRDKVERALPGTRTAINVAGIDRDALRRGMVLARPGTLRGTGAVDVCVRAVDSLAHALHHNAHLTFHSGSDEAPARMRLLDVDGLRGGDTAWAQLKLAAEVAVARGDRFVLRTPDDTVAGGTIVDIAPKRHRRHHAPTIAALEAMMGDDPERTVLDAIARAPMIDHVALVSALTLPGDAVDAALEALREAGTIERFTETGETRYALGSFVAGARQQIAQTLADYHREHPLHAGMASGDLRARVRLDARAFQLIAGGMPELRLSGATVALASFAPAPSSEQQLDIERFLAELRAAPFRPPATTLHRELLAYLVEHGTVVDAGDGIVIDAEAVASMREAVRSYIEREGSISLAQARDLLGSNRRFAQALLEHLDRLRVTRRVGETRVLR